MIVLISKPPSPAIAARILALAAALRASRPSCIFSAPRPVRCSGAGLHAAAIAGGTPPTSRSRSRSGEPNARLPPRCRRTSRVSVDEHALDGLAHTQRTVRGTVHRRHVLLRGAARVPAPRAAVPLERARAGRDCRSTASDADGHVFIDMGDDEYTRGRPHPMIDPSLRNAAIRDAGRRPARRRSCCSTSCSASGRIRDPADDLADALRGRAARGARARAHAGADRPRLRHRWRSAGPGGAGSHARSPPVRSSPTATSRRRRSRRSSRCSSPSEARRKRDEDAVQGHADGRQRRPRRLRRQHRRRRRRMRRARVAAARARRSRRGLGARADLQRIRPSKRANAGRVRALSRRQSGADRCRDRARRAARDGRRSPADPARRAADRLAGDVRTDARRDARRRRCSKAGPIRSTAAHATGRTRAASRSSPATTMAPSGRWRASSARRCRVWVVENTTGGNRAYSNFNEGLGKVLRFGANGPRASSTACA